jgi:antitoxin component YwqK of YwqJK toxin-antitoxin module
MNNRLLFIIALSAFTISSFCQTAPDLNQTDKNGEKQGHWIRKYANNNIMYEGTFKDNHPVGEFRRYYENAVLQSVLIHSTDGKEADATIYHPNGFMASKGKYINQIKEGKWLFYSSDVSGYLFCEEEYKGNVRNGPSVKYYPNGKIAEKITFLNNVRQGEWTQFFTDGTMCLKSFYKNGKLEGKYEVWDEKGKIEFSGQYKNDARDGNWVIYSPDGSLRYKIEYKEGITKDLQSEIDMSDYMDELEKNKGKISDPEKTGVIRK